MLNCKNLSKIATTILLALSLTACANMHTGTGTTGSSAAAKDTTAQNAPYFPTSFNDFEVPGELKLDSKHTMFINTSSFTGGVIALAGRVEMASLADFFVNSMQKNNWHLIGEVRYQNTLLAFTKPNKNCMISIYSDSFGYETKVTVYISDNNLSNNGQ